MIIELTKDEANSLMQILDIALRAQGISLVKAVTIIADKIVDAENAPVQPV